MNENDHVLFAGADGVISSFVTTRAVSPDEIPPPDICKPGVAVAFGPVLITAPLGREIGYLQVGDFRQPLLPRRRVWRSGPRQLIFPQPVPQRYWQLEVDAPAAAHARLDAVLNELCKFQSLSALPQYEGTVSEAEENWYSGSAKETSPSPLVLDAIAAIKLRTVPVAQASQEINEKKLGPPRIVSNSFDISRPGSRSASYQLKSAPTSAIHHEITFESPKPRPHTDPVGHLITPETSHELNPFESSTSPTKAVISRFDYFETVGVPSGSRPLSPLSQHELKPVLDIEKLTLRLSEPAACNPLSELIQPESVEPSFDAIETASSTEALGNGTRIAIVDGAVEVNGKLGDPIELKSQEFNDRAETPECDLVDEEDTPVAKLSPRLAQSAFILSPVTSPKGSAFDTTPCGARNSSNDDVVCSPRQVSNAHSVSSSSTLDDILELFAPEQLADFKVPLDGSATVSELAQRNLLQFSPPSTPTARSVASPRNLPFYENVRFCHPLIPAPIDAVSYRMRPPRPAMPQSVHHDVTTVGGFVGWQLMNRILPPRR